MQGEPHSEDERGVLVGQDRPQPRAGCGKPHRAGGIGLEGGRGVGVRREGVGDKCKSSRFSLNEAFNWLFSGVLNRLREQKTMSESVTEVGRAVRVMAFKSSPHDSQYASSDGLGKNGEISDFQSRMVFEAPFKAIENPRFTFIDLFSGIGGFRIALQSLGGKCVFSSEINKSAAETYAINFGEVPSGDIRDFTMSLNSNIESKIPVHDILAAGFPCQPFSLAGVSARNSLGLSHGFEDEDQGNLFFEIEKIVEVLKPKVLFLENVKNFRSHDSGNTFNTVKSIIEGLGYDFNSAVINANRLVPQSRERFYMVAFLGGDYTFTFPQFEGPALPLKSILEKDVDDRYTISDKLWQGHKRRTSRNLSRGTGFTAFEADINKPSKTIVARYGKDGKECLIPQLGKNPRKLTPRECARLQGFPEQFILPRSDAAAYRQFGNSVSVPVIQAISMRILKHLGYDI